MFLGYMINPITFKNGLFFHRLSELLVIAVNHVTGKMIYHYFLHTNMKNNSVII